MEVVGRRLKVEPAAAKSRFSSGVVARRSVAYRTSSMDHLLFSSRGRVSPLPIPEVISSKQRRPKALAVLHPASVLELS